MNECQRTKLSEQSYQQTMSELRIALSRQTANVVKVQQTLFNVIDIVAKLD
jgi:hypothetical protein